MDKLAQDMSMLRDELEPNWDDERAARLYQGVGRLRRRRAVQRAAIGSASLAAVALLAVKLALPGAVPAPDQMAKAPSAPVQPSAAPVGSTAAPAEAVHTLRLADGSVASLIGEHSELSILENTAARVDLKLLAGRAQFDVVKNRARDFVVEAGEYHVTVVGTVFAVEHFERRVEVSVVEGTVRVEGPAGTRVLTTGEEASFDASGETAKLEQPAPAEGEPKALRKKARPGDRPSWRSLSKNGDYDAAYALISQGTEVDNDPSALMDAADAARLSGHPAGAVKYLERVLGEHRNSPVAPLAAFTLGRVFLDHLGQPHRAADSFALARRLAPAGSLAQDALAREVESLSKGGDEREANVKAKEYLRDYPKGRRLRAVQLYGGIE